MFLNFKKNQSEAWNSFIQLKNKEGVRVIDTHMHPLDVMGAVNHSRLPDDARNGYSYPDPSIIDTRDFGQEVQAALRVMFRYFPGIIKRAIRNMYKESSEEFLISYLNDSGIDRAVLIPIEPAVKTSAIFTSFSGLGERAIFLGSVDFKKAPGDIVSSLKVQLSDFDIKGIKLHPNFQGFYPEPSYNMPQAAEKLLAIYKFAEKNNLYILFHGGESNLWRNSIYPDAGRRYALLENFIKNGSSSELFGNINIPIIIAHMGMHNLSRPPISDIKTILKKYQNVSFDTSGVSGKSIEQVIREVGIERIVFGSDAPYYNARAAITRVYSALYKIYSDADVSLPENSRKIFSENFLQNILNKVWR